MCLSLSVFLHLSTHWQRKWSSLHLYRISVKRIKVWGLSLRSWQKAISILCYLKVVFKGESYENCQEISGHISHPRLATWEILRQCVRLFPPLLIIIFHIKIKIFFFFFLPLWHLFKCQLSTSTPKVSL